MLLFILSSIVLYNMANEYYRHVNTKTYHGERDCTKLQEEAKTSNALLVYKKEPKKYTACNCVK
jgi:hypothetical protein